MLNKMDKFDTFVPHPLVITPVLLSFLTSKTVQSEITRPARWWGCRKTMSKVQNNKFQNKRKKTFD